MPIILTIDNLECNQRHVTPPGDGWHHARYRSYVRWMRRVRSHLNNGNMVRASLAMSSAAFRFRIAKPQQDKQS